MAGGDTTIASTKNDAMPFNSGTQKNMMGAGDRYNKDTISNEVSLHEHLMKQDVRSRSCYLSLNLKLSGDRVLVVPSEDQVLQSRRGH
jgi:hypothetical protein